MLATACRATAGRTSSSAAAPAVSFKIWQPSRRPARTQPAAAALAAVRRRQRRRGSESRPSLTLVRAEQDSSGASGKISMTEENLQQQLKELDRLLVRVLPCWAGHLSGLKPRTVPPHILPVTALPLSPCSWFRFSLDRAGLGFLAGNRRAGCRGRGHAPGGVAGGAGRADVWQGSAGGCCTAGVRLCKPHAALVVGLVPCNPVKAAASAWRRPGRP